MEQPSLPSPEFRPDRAKWVAWAALGVFGIAFMIGLGLTINQTAKPAFCGSCHNISGYVTSWRAGGHKKVRCLKCHRDPGIFGGVSYRLRMLRYYSLSKSYLRRHRPSLTTGGFSACGQCHKRVLKETVTSKRGIRISHREIADEGIGCDRCHINIAHESKALGVMRPMHDYCFACHQKEQQEQECEFCHEKDLSVAGPKDLGSYRKVNLKSLQECTGCHATESCKVCHSGS